MITLGGNAELELVDSMDPFSEGIIFSVMPPKKSWKNISNLSGGEKVIKNSSMKSKPDMSLLQTLSSLALVFALHVFKVGRFRMCSQYILNNSLANTLILYG
jgi:structural maintenance of chromosome 4